MRTGGRSIKHGNIEYIWPTSTSNSNIWIGEQVDPWGKELSSREAQRIQFWKNNGGRNGCGHGDDKVIKHRDIAKHLAAIHL